MTWYQMLIVFGIYGLGARIDVLLGQEGDVGFWTRQLVNLPFTAAAFVLTDHWAGVTW